MSEKMQIGKWENSRKIIIIGLILLLVIALIVFLRPVLQPQPPQPQPQPQPGPSGKTVYVTTNGSGTFNCDGTDDQVEINRALTYVAENPDYTTVHLQGDSTYVISDTIFIGNKTTLEGDSTAVIQLEDEADWPLEQPLIIQKDDFVSDVTIRGFEIDGNHDNNAEKARGKGYYNMIDFIDSENIKVHDMYLHDSHGDGLQVTRCSNVQFYNNRVYKLGHDGFYAIYSTDVAAWNNTITCRTNSGLRAYNTNHVKFYNNTINSEGEGGAGIQIQKDGDSTIMNDIQIYNNLLNQTNAAGVWVTGYGSKYPKDEAENIQIHDNKFYETGTNQGADWAGGVVLSGFQNTQIENNFFDGCYGAAIAHKRVDEFKAPGTGYTTFVRDNIIINTQRSHAAGNGYAVFNKLNRTHSFVLENNCLSNNAGGNYVYANSTSDVEVEEGYVEEVMENEALRKEFPWRRALDAGPK
jgi:hypothetical protein